MVIFVCSKSLVVQKQIVFVFHPELFKNDTNRQVVSHEELHGVLNEFKHSILGSVRVSVMDAMKAQAREKQKQQMPVLQPQPSTSGCYNPMVDSDTDSDHPEAQVSSDSEVECW